MRHKSILLLAAALMVVLLLSGSALAFSGTGSGTEADPYVITTVQELQEMQDELDACYALGNNIDASITSEWNGGEGFIPVGIFTGTFDGNRYTIDSLHINRINSSDQGLFSVLSGAIVKNVHIVNANVTFYRSGGILAGNINSDSIVTYCSATGNVTLKPGSDDGRGGGIAGNVRTGSHVDRCFSDVNVNAGGRRQVGGLVGYLRGRGYYTELTNSYSLGTVTGSGSKQGNLLGDADDSRVDKCYSCGYGKALIGFNWGHPVITNSYWDKDKGAYSSHYGGMPKTTMEMMQQATFVNWDFVEVWDIIENETYPFLRPYLKPILVDVDIKPGSCPNPLNVKSRGILSVAVLGSEDFDVNGIDIASIRLAGIAAIRNDFEDIGTSLVDANECECTTEGPDGFPDLILKFETQMIVEALGEVDHGDELVLELTGVLADETPIEGSDCVIIRGRHKPVNKADFNGDGTVDMADFAAFTENWLQ
jgi:hypothetical protein